MTRLKALILSIAIATGGAVSPAVAQDETLADIRQELSVLFVEVQRLKRELSTTGGAGGVTADGSALERIDMIEAELQRLTAKTEQLEFRVESVVKDGTNRIGDLEFRLVELEGGDVGQLGQTSTLGGGQMPDVAAVAAPSNTTGGAELAIGEQTDFERAKAALASGDFRGAADQFKTFTETYPGGPLSAEAHYLRGEALEGQGEMTGAARAFLESFSWAPGGPKAPDALYKLGTSLAALGQTQEACVTLGEVQTRFPSSEATLLAQSALRNLSCS